MPRPREQRNVYGRCAGFGGAAVVACWAIALMLTSAAHASEITWIGGTSLDWNTPANWSPRQVPGVDLAGVDVQIPSARGVIVANLLPLTLGDIHFSTAVRFAGSFVTITGGDATDLELTNDGELHLLGPLAANGTTQWIHGRFDGGAPLSNHGTLFVPTTSQVRTLRTPLINLGTVSQGGKLNVAGGHTITNLGTWELPSLTTANLQEESGLPSESFVNKGTLKRTGVGMTELLLNVEQSAGASIEVSAGEILFKRASEHKGGTYTLSNNAAIRVWPDTSVLTKVSGDVTLTGVGNVSWNGGALQVTAGTTLLNELDLGSSFGLHFVAADTFQLDGTLHNDGKLTWDSGAIVGGGVLENGSRGTLILISPGTLKATLRNQALGQVFHTGNVMIDGGAIEVLADSTWLVGNGSVFQSGVGGTMRIAGVVEKQGTQGNQTLLGAPIIFDGGTVFTQGPGNVSFIAGGTVESGGTVTTVFGQLATFAAGLWTLEGDLVTNGGGAFSGTSGLRFHASGGSLRNQHPIQSECVLTGVQFTAASTDDVTLVNEGNIRLASCSTGTATNPVGAVQNAAQLLLTGGNTVRGTLTNNDGAEMKQQGDVSVLGGSVINAGTWTILSGNVFGDGSATTANVSGGKLHSFTNSTIAGTFDNKGLVEIFTGVLTIANSVQVQGSVLKGGDWVIHDLGKLVFAGASVTTIGAGTEVTIHGDHSPPGDFWDIVTGVDTDAVLTLAPETDMDVSNLTTIRGQLVLNGGPGSAVNVDGELESILGDIDEVFVGSFADGASGTRLVTPRLLNGGRIRPGGPSAAGGFHLTGTLTQNAAGTLAIELAGETPFIEHDRVEVDGDVELGGTLWLTLLNGFVPEVGESFVILAATGAITGAFDQLVSDGGRFSVSNEDGSVTATFEGSLVLGDLDGDGSVSAPDLAILLGAWGTSGPADLDGNGDVNALDLAILLGAWG